MLIGLICFLHPTLISIFFASNNSICWYNSDKFALIYLPLLSKSIDFNIKQFCTFLCCEIHSQISFINFWIDTVTSATWSHDHEHSGLFVNLFKQQYTQFCAYMWMMSNFDSCYAEQDCVCLSTWEYFFFTSQSLWKHTDNFSREKMVHTNKLSCVHE